MADSQTEQPRESRVSKALLGRVTAVALFVVLGTAAVLFMMDDTKEKSQGLAGESTGTPTADASPTNKQAESAAGLIAQVKANLAGNSPAPAKPVSNDFRSVNTSPGNRNQGSVNTNPLGNPASLPNPVQKPQSNFSDQAFAPQSAAPPDRFAALDKFGAPPLGGVQPTHSPTQDGQTPGAPNGSATKLTDNLPQNNSAPIKPIQLRDNSNSNLPGNLGAFQPNPATAGNAPAKPSAELKPFTAPELTNRLAGPANLNAPNLTAPVPSRVNQNPMGADPPKVADNSPFDNIGKSSGNGILKPAGSAPSNIANHLPNEPTNHEPARLNPSASLTNQNQLPGNSSFGNANSASPDNLKPREVGTPNGFGPAPMTRLPSTQSPPADPALSEPSNRSFGQSGSTPVSSGSAINQPLSSAPRATVPNNNSSLVNTEARTANVPGERRFEGVQAPALTVEKLSPKEVTLNEVADFVIVIRNVGRVVANDVTVHDQVPANTEFQGSEPQATQSPSDRRLVWQVGSIAPGQEKRVNYRLKPTTPGEIGSVAQVTFATQASMRTIVTNPVLEIVHRAKPVAMVGSDVIFDVLLSNKGNGPAKDVLIQEDVPAQLQYQEGYRELEYEVGTLLPGQSKRIQLPLKAVSVGKLRNTISAIATGGQRVQHEIDLEIVAPKLMAQSDGPTKRFLGRQVAHQFKVINQGSASATNVDLIAKLPSGLRFMQTNNQGVYRRENHAVYWSMAELSPNGEAVVELLTMPVEAGTQDIKFEAVSDLNQTASVSHALNIEHLVDIFFDIDDLVDPIEVGADTAYQIKVANQGTQAANNVQLQVEFPNGITPTTIEGTLQHQIVGQRVQFAPINNLKPSEQLTVVVRAKGQTAGDHRVVVSMQADGRQAAISKEEMTRVYADR